MQFLFFFWIAATLRVQFAGWMWPSSPAPPCCCRVGCVAGLLLAADTFCCAVYKDSPKRKLFTERVFDEQHICNMIQWTNKTKTLFNRSQSPLFPAERLASYSVHEFPWNSPTRVHPLPDFLFIFKYCFTEWLCCSLHRNVLSYLWPVQVTRCYEGC